MIHDDLANHPRYHGLHPRFSAAFAWLTDTRNHALPDGRFHVDGENLFAIIEGGISRPATEKRFESHRRYLDIQLNLEGGEIMEWCPTRLLRVEDDFQPDNDICFYHQPAALQLALPVRPMQFAVFLQTDAHKPCCHLLGNAAPFRKIVMKVLG